MLCQYGCGGVANHLLSSGKHCCSDNFRKCPEVRRKNSLGVSKSYKGTNDRISKLKRKVSCKHCGEEKAIVVISKHERTCYLNPENLTLCPVCDKPIKSYKTAQTCSNKCAGQLFKDKYTDIAIEAHETASYRTVCFEFHGNCCIICGEARIVHVHHIDEDNKNNHPSNLVPLCPTHHAICHSSFYKDIEDEIMEHSKKEIVINTNRRVLLLEKCS